MSLLKEIFQISFLGTAFTLYDVCFIFFFYSVLGWCVEVCYMTVQLGYFENRGFLNGPLCPIYGFGVLMVIILLTPLVSNLLVLFVGSALLCTALELAVGVGMEKLFHNTWWDYSMEKFNYKGYICLKISIMWGLSCVCMMRVLQPFLMRVVRIIPKPAGIVFLLVCFGLVIFDLVISLCVVNRLNQRLSQLDDIAKKLRFASENIGSTLAGETLELKAKYDALLEKKTYAQERLLRAFPTMHSAKYYVSMEQLKQKLQERLSVSQEDDSD